MTIAFGPPPPCRAVLFDLDGTILNTNRLIIQSFQHVFRRVAQQEITESQVIACFGEPLSTSLRRLAPDAWEDMLMEYRLYSLEHHDDLTEIFPGVVDGLRQLKDAGLALGVVTSKLRTTAKKGLDLFDLAPFFDVLVGMEDCQRHKPDPEPVLLGCTGLGARPGETMMVGDSAFDIRSAKQAGVYAVGVAWSVHSSGYLQEAGADAIVEEFGDICRLVLRHQNPTS